MTVSIPMFDTVSKAEQGVKFYIRRPDGMPAETKSGEPMFVTLLGSDSQTYRTAIRTNVLRRLDKTARPLTPSEEIDRAEADMVEVLVRCTTGWNLEGGDGKPVAFTNENAREIYKKYPFVREQAERFITERSNFFGD